MVDPPDAQRVFRHDAFAATRGQKAPVHRCRIMWHDSTDRSLAAQGLILAEQAGQWRLERLRPDAAAPWPPGTPPEVVATAASAAALAPVAPAHTMPIAGFEGRETRRAVMVDGEAVEVALRRGTLRAVADETEACRLILAGPPAAVRSLALSLSGSLRIAVPRSSLAAEGIALAEGQPPPARRLGAPDAPGDGATVRGTFQNAIGHFADVLLHYAPLAAADTHGTEPVHQMRVAVRRARSMIAVFRSGLPSPAIERANRDLRALGARLGPTRDWDVFVTETVPAVTAAFPEDMRLARLAGAAAARRKGHHGELEAFLTSPAFRQLGIELAWLAMSPDWDTEPAPEADPEAPIEATTAVAPADAAAEAVTVQEFGAVVMHKRSRKLTSFGKKIKELDLPSLHELRLHAKRARYAAEVFAPLFPERATRRYLRRLSAVQQALGVLNDGAVASHLMEELGGPGGRHSYAVGLILGFIAARAEALRPGILDSWEKFRRSDPFWA